MKLGVNIKGLAPVVAISLLLVVSVSAAVFFQNWFYTFQSIQLTEIERQTQSSLSGSSIEAIVGNDIYFKNNDLDNLSINKVLINGDDCLFSDNLSIGLNKLNLTTCLENVSSPIVEVLIFTNDKIFEKTLYYKDLNSNSTSGGSTTLPPSPVEPKEKYFLSLFGDFENFDEFRGFDMALTDDGGFVSTGYANKGGSDLDLFIAKFNSTGGVEWAKTLDSTSSEQTKAILTLDDGYVIGLVTSSYVSLNSYDPMLIKVDFDGNLLWATTYPGNGQASLDDMILSSDGTILITGNNIVTGYISKINPLDGSVIWFKTNSGQNSLFPKSIYEHTDGTLYTAGYSNNGGSNNIYYSKFYAHGAPVHSRYLNTGSYDFGGAVYVGNDSSIYVGGRTFYSGTDKFAILKFDTTGTSQWFKVLGGSASSNDYITSMKGTNDGNILIYGTTSAQGGGDFSLTKLDYSGTVLWNRIFDGAQHVYGINGFVYQKNDSSIFATGSMRHLTGEGMASFVTKFNSSGFMGNSSMVIDFDFPSDQMVTPSIGSFNTGSTTRTVNAVSKTISLEDLYADNRTNKVLVFEDEQVITVG